MILLSNCLPQIALEALSEHENTQKNFRAMPPDPLLFPIFIDSLICPRDSEYSNRIVSEGEDISQPNSIVTFHTEENPLLLYHDKRNN